ncbi:MAG: NADH-quinone oxidoreductase subunit NuoK [Caldilineaceae bacterium]|nr:NADH-quinone oxidoreductase subunit NuoK [Caldilineaceae bacterium]
MIPTSYYLILAALIFAVGATGVLVRRNALIIFMCIEMMLNSVNLTLIALSRQWGNLNGQVFVFMIMAVAAAEVAVGLAILISNTRHRKSINIDEINLLKW